MLSTSLNLRGEITLFIFELNESNLTMNVKFSDIENLRKRT